MQNTPRRGRPPSEEKRETRRATFDMPLEIHELMLALKTRTSASSYQEVVSRSLKVMAWVEGIHNSDRKLIIQEPDGSLTQLEFLP